MTVGASWKEVTLEDHVDLVVGYAFKSSGYTDDESDVRLLRGDNVAQGELRWDKAKRWPVADYQRYEAFHLREGDLILAMDRPWISAGLKYARVKCKDTPALLVQRVARLRGTESLKTDYLRCVIGSADFTDYVLSILTGVNIPHISAKDIKRFRFLLPPVEAQEKISKVITSYDDLIENNTRRIDILEEMARRLYEEWFVQLRFPGREDVVFEKMPIHNVADIVRGRSYRSADLVENGRPFVNLKCINRDGGYRRDGLKYYSGKFKPEQLVSAGDIVMAVTDMTQERRIVARAALVPDLGELEGVISMDLVRIIPRNGVSALYLYAFFRWSDFSDNVKNHATGANVLHLHPDLIANYDIDLPPHEVCKAFAEKVRPAIELADVLEKKNANLRAQRDLLLPKLISGEIDVSDIPMPT